MTATDRCADAPLTRHTNWRSVDWKIVRAEVRRLQVRIAKAVREKKFSKAISLQWMLTHSYYAKLWAIKRVTTNRWTQRS